MVTARGLWFRSWRSLPRGQFHFPGSGGPESILTLREMQTRSLQQQSLHLDTGRRAADVDSRAIQRVGAELQHFAGDTQRLRAWCGGRLGQLHVSDDRRFSHLGSRLGHQQTQPDPVSIEFQLLVTVLVGRHFQRRSVGEPARALAPSRVGVRCGGSIRRTGLAATVLGRRIWLVEPDFQPRGVSAELFGIGIDVALGEHLDGSNLPLHTSRWRRGRKGIVRRQFSLLRWSQFDLRVRVVGSRDCG